MGSVDMSKNSAMICTPLTAHTVEEVLCQMHEAKVQGAGVVEVRLDSISNLRPQCDLEALIRNRPLPVIIAYGLKKEGGEGECDEHSILQALHLARQLGADYVEVDVKVAPVFMQEHKSNPSNGSKTIVSCYVDGMTPSKEDLSTLVANIASTKADIVKLVTSAADITEIARLFHTLSHSLVPLIAYSLGERGLISQILCRKFGGFLVYGSMKGHSVPGLPSLNMLRQAYKIEHIDVDTKVFGLISKPVSHSKGPILHNPTFQHVKFNGIYVPMFVDDLKAFFSVYSSPDFAGFSVGFPYKEAMIGFCDEVHPLAQLIGAVNTIVRRPDDGKLVGYNTDSEASITAIEDALSEPGCTDGDTSFTSLLNGKLFVLVGAGGAGRALAFGAKRRGARLIIFDIDYERAKSLACSVSGDAQPYEDLPNFRPEKGAILANATPLGMHSNVDRIPVDEVTLRDYQLVFDCVYTPRKTKLLRDAEAAGAVVVTGVEMFLRQAIGQFNLFTNSAAPEEFMREIVLAEF